MRPFFFSWLYGGLNTQYKINVFEPFWYFNCDRTEVQTGAWQFEIEVENLPARGQVFQTFLYFFFGFTRGLSVFHWFPNFNRDWNIVWMQIYVNFMNKTSILLMVLQWVMDNWRKRYWDILNISNLNFNIKIKLEINSREGREFQ